MSQKNKDHMQNEHEENRMEQEPAEADVKDVDVEQNVGTEEQELTQEERAAKAAADIAEMLEKEEAKAAHEKKDAKDALIDDLNDRLKRSLAEFDNFRKRTEKEKSSMFDMGAKMILEKLLPTIDNFERALKNVPEDKECEVFAQGMDMIYKQLLKNMEDAGVTVIDCIGKSFDPNLHNAVMHVEDDSISESTVIEEFQKGYMYKDVVLRYSTVKVAN